MEKKSAAELLTSVDELFTTQAERDNVKRETVKNIPISLISDFPNHPFKVRMDEAMVEMAESVKQYGVLVPAMVRPKPEGGYEMVAGHRRKLAAELAQQTEIPCLVRELSDEETVIVMVDSNLQREKILPSEKAFAYKMKLDAMKRQQGERTDLTSVPLGQKLGLTSREMLADNSPDTGQISKTNCDVITYTAVFGGTGPSDNLSEDAENKADGQETPEQTEDQERETESGQTDTAKPSAKDAKKNALLNWAGCAGGVFSLGSAVFWVVTDWKERRKRTA